MSSFRPIERNIRNRYRRDFEDHVEAKLNDIEQTLLVGEDHDALAIDQLIEYACETNGHLRKLLIDVWETRTFNTVSSSLKEAIENDLAELLDSNAMRDRAARDVYEDMNLDLEYAADQHLDRMHNEGVG